MRLIRRVILFCGLLAGTPFSNIVAQMPIEWRVNTFDESKGLSSRKITHMLEDHRGYLWIGTPDGLNRFDGYGFKVFRKIPGDSTSIGGNYITYIAEDKNNNIWIAFLTGGVSCYNTTTGRFRNYPPNNLKKGSLPSSEISTIFTDSKNEIWVGVTQRGLYHLDPKTGLFIHRSINDFSDPFYTPQLKVIYNTVYEIYEDKQGLFWMATHDGLYTYDRKTDRFTPIRNEQPRIGVLRNDLFGTIIPDSTKGFWLGSWAGGISYYNIKDNNWKIFKYDTAHRDKETANVISDLKRNARGDLWVTTYDRGFGLFTVRLNSYLFFGDHDSFHTNIPAKQTYKVLEDRERNIWVSHIGGLTKIEQRRRLFFFKPIPVKNSYGVEAGEVRAVMHDRDSIHQYLATAYGQGLYIIDTKSTDTTTLGFATRPSEEKNMIVSDLLQDRAGKVWVLTRDYLFRLEKETKKLVKVALNDPDKALRSDLYGRIMEDSKGLLWITTATNGVFRYDPANGAVKHFCFDKANPSSIGSDVIRTVAEDLEGRLWFGGIRGCLSILDPATGQFNNIYPQYLNPSALASNRVWSLRADSLGYMWVATDVGLYQVDYRKKRVPTVVKQYTAADGLQADLATALQLDNSGNIWAITPVCLTMINPVTKKVTSFNAQDGLLKEDIGIRLLQGPGSRMYMTAAGGYYQFDPATITKATGKQPTVFINSFKVFDRERNFGDTGTRNAGLRLNYDENFFSFEFVAIDFNRPERQQYAYMLEGFDKDWIYSGNRRYASYTNLPGGTYHFRVKAGIGGETWGPETVIPLKISSPFYKQWWFIIALISAIAIAVIMAVRRRTKSVRAEKEEIEIQTAINYFASGIYEQQTVDAILKDVARNCISRLHFEDCVIYLLDEYRQTLVPTSAFGLNNPSRDDVANAIEIPIGTGIVGSVALSGLSEMIADTSLDKRYIVDGQARFSEITVPMIYDGKVLGIIDCEHSGKDFFTEKHLSILTTIASLCAN
ncbi:MAG: GAF domain-containing protein, partial [Pedobacter sp.]